MTETIFWENLGGEIRVFSLAHVLLVETEEGGVYVQYCSLPPGVNLHVLAPFLEALLFHPSLCRKMGSIDFWCVTF